MWVAGGWNGARPNALLRRALNLFRTRLEGGRRRARHPSGRAPKPHVLWQTSVALMQLFPQGLPFVQCGALLAEVVAVLVVVVAVVVAAAAAGHLMNLPVVGSLHDLASAAPAIIVSANANMTSLVMGSLPK